MAKSGWNISTGWLDDLESDLKKGAQKVCDDFGRRALESARAGVSVDKGALKASGYLKTPQESGYQSAVDEAKLKPDTDISTRHQVEPEMSLFTHPDFKPEFARAVFAWSLFDFPLSYAGLIDGGFYHARARRQIPGVHFIHQGESAAGDFEAAQQEMVNRLMRKMARPANK